MFHVDLVFLFMYWIRCNQFVVKIKQILYSLFILICASIQFETIRNKKYGHRKIAKQLHTPTYRK